MPRTAILVGPRDNGRPMSLEDFEFAEVKEGYRFELSRGVIAVSEVADPAHAAQIQAIHVRMGAYSLNFPDRISLLAAGSDCKLLVWDTESERHPDLTIYNTPRPKGRNPWRKWVPAIVIEVVSPSSKVRDYVEKREDYLHLGIKEYWIVDAKRREMTVLRRQRDNWVKRIVEENETYATRLLPGFALELAAVFAAADAAKG